MMEQEEKDAVDEPVEEEHAEEIAEEALEGLADDAGGVEGDEVIELEFSEDDIESYLVDEDGNEVGFTMLDEDGNEVEYFYADEEEDDSRDAAEVSSGASGEHAGRRGEDDGEEYDLGITREGVAQVTKDCNGIYQEGLATAAELKEAFSDIAGAFNFLKK